MNYYAGSNYSNKAVISSVILAGRPVMAFIKHHLVSDLTISLWSLSLYIYTTRDEVTPLVSVT